MKPEKMSLAFLHIGWLSAVVGEARLQKPLHKTPKAEKFSQGCSNDFGVRIKIKFFGSFVK